MMESGKLDIDSEVKNPKEPVATYKPIPEDDSLLAARESANENLKMAKHDGDVDTEDGAEELMLKNSGKINSNKDANEVKFISENGDAKIDIETVKQALTGMTKEELMKFANDPFWIRLRWFMFITFWLLWVAMLAGAIAIIVMAPKCKVPEPKKLWQKSTIVRLNPSALSSNFKELEQTLKKLDEKNIKVISIGSILESSPDGNTIDFRNIQPKSGNIKDFKALIEAAGENKQEIILEVDPNHTSDNHKWFNDSVHRIEPFTNYYVWANKTDENEGRPQPNNWLSVYNGSAWEWNEIRQQYYLHQFKKSQPDLNYANPAVVDEFSHILTHWMKLGVTGFRLANTQYLLENLAAGNEHSNDENSVTYTSQLHVHTYDLTDNTQILSKWRNVVSNFTNNKGLFSLQEDIKNDTSEVLNERSVVDLPQKSHFFFTANADISASAIQIGVNKSLPSLAEQDKPEEEKKMNESWPAWDLNGPQNPLNERMNQSVAESLTLMTLLLPGTPILSLAQTEYPGKAFEALSKARDQPAFLHGKTQLNVTDGTVFIYTRVKSGNPGYLVAYQSGDNSTILDLSKFDKVPDEVTIIALSSNYAEKNIDTETNIVAEDIIHSDHVPISPKSTLVVQFAPKSG